MTTPAATVLDDTLKRDVAILSTLAQLHCATVVQLHALCFPYHTLATARTTLFYLAEAHFIARSTWRLRGLSQERGQVWIEWVVGFAMAASTGRGVFVGPGICRKCRPG
jgi:hypothetical protein